MTGSGLGWLAEALLDSGVALIEQPLRAAPKRSWKAIARRSRSPPTRACCRGRSAGSRGRFDMINIKLDKCGGLTEALVMVEEARRLGLGVMVGNMVGTSLAMAPAFIVGQHCDIVDLDGPTFLARDRSPGVVYRDGHILCGDEVWGGGGKLAA